MKKWNLQEFEAYLRQEERSSGTIEKYLRDVRAFAAWAGERELTRELVHGWKEYLVASGYQSVTINSMLAAVNRWLQFIGRGECCIRYLKIQKKLFRNPERELEKDEYLRLVQTARETGKERLALLLETICSTGIRVSEVRYITVSAIRRGRAEIALKGKNRVILLPGKLCRKLQKYAKKQKIASGELFVTRSGKPLSRKQIWAEMKALCKAAGVEASKVFPHNLRHIFARTFYKTQHDLAKLADLLGHSSVETTRIYLLSTGREHAREIERLGLVS